MRGARAVAPSEQLARSRPTRGAGGLTVPTPLQAFFYAAGQHPLLTREQEVALAKRKEAGDRSAREELIRANYRLVAHIAKRYRGRGVSFEDLLHEGVLGLIRAVDRFDWRRGCKVSTVGYWWIHEACRSAVHSAGRAIRVPGHVADRRGFLAKIAHEIEAANGEPPTREELVAASGLSAAEVEEALDAASVVKSLDQPRSDNDAYTLADDLREDDRDPADDPDGTIDVQRVLRSLLGDEQRRIVELRVGLNGSPEPMSLSEVGEELGLSRERVLQIERHARRFLRSRLTSQLL